MYNFELAFKYKIVDKIEIYEMINNLFSSLIQIGCNNLDCDKILQIIENFKPLSKNLQNKIYTGLLSNI